VLFPEWRLKNLRLRETSLWWDLDGKHKTQKENRSRERGVVGVGGKNVEKLGD